MLNTGYVSIGLCKLLVFTYPASIIG